MIDLINNWMATSTDNFNIMVAIISVIHIVSLAVLFYVSKKFGPPDERTSGIFLKVVSFMFTSQLIMNAIFISLVSGEIEYFRQFFLLFQGITFLLGAIYALRLYILDFK